MNTIFQCWLPRLLLCLLFLSADVTAQSQALTLLGRSQLDGSEVELGVSDLQWLWNKRTLRLGTSAPDYPPFDIVSNTQDYQGITADLVGLIGELLHLEVEVLRYPSRQAAIEALRRGEIDLLGSANAYDAGESDLVLSQPYADDLPTLVTRVGEADDAMGDLAGKRVAMAYHYLPTDMVRKAYPDAELQFHPSIQNALGAVAFGQADVFLGNLLSASFLTSRSYLSNVQLANFASLEPGSFALVLRRDDTDLLRLVDWALGAIPSAQRWEILRRWGVASSSLAGGEALQFSDAEQQWMGQHPRVRVLFIESFVPFTFRDEQGRFRGVAADVLERIGFRTGLQFDAQPVATLTEAAEKIRKGEADMFASLTPSKSREADFQFTRSYFNNAYVLVARDAQEAPASLDEMTGRRLAVIRGNELIDYLVKHYPGVRLVMADNAQAVMALVARGEADAAVNTLISARYLISREYRGRLRMVATVGTTPGHVAFAVGRDARELHAVLEKALLSISPDELESLTNRWRREVVVEDGFWEVHSRTIIGGFLLAALLLVVALVWIRQLRGQIRRREAVERKLTDQMEFLRVLIDGTPHPIYVRDRQARLMTCNQAYLDVFDVRREEVIGKRLSESDLARIPEAMDFEAWYFQAMAEDEPRLRDSQLTFPNGRTMTIFHWMHPYRQGDGEMAGIIAGWIDISERQRLLREADEANRAKTTFLATMSHEIRTPLNAVIGMLELASKKADKGELDRLALDVASDAASHLLELIGDILDIARIESGKLSLAPERTQLPRLVESVVRVFDGLARQKHIRLAMELDPATRLDVSMDPLRFKQVLSNVVGNAVKFTDEGEVRVSLRALPSDAEGPLRVELTVTDTGVGILDTDLQRLFKPFSQAGNSPQQARSGSGLGLMIARSLCEMMGGRLTLTSTYGVGTTVRVALELELLPEANDPQVEAPAADETPMAALRVLVVDDYPANRMLLSQQLGFLGHSVTEAEDGAKGVEAWRAQPFDVVISDCNMPVMNGYEMASLIRAEELRQGQDACLILGFTANAQADEVLRCRSAGMDGCMFKPVSLDQLVRHLGAARSVVSTISVAPGCSALMDVSSLEALTGGNNEAMKDLLGKLITCNQEDLARLDEILVQDDRQELARLAHRVKGGARIIKARPLEECCDMLEEAVAAEVVSEELASRVDDLRDALRRLTDVLDAYCGA